MLRFFAGVGCLIALSGTSAHAGTYNSVLSIGDAAPAWEDLEGVDGKRYALADFHERKALVIVFTSNTCPYAVDYQQRVNELARQYVGKDSPVAVVAINSNKIAEDQLPAMKQRAEEAGFVFPYLDDPTQQTAKAYGARRTPECVVLDQQRRVVYLGAFDDDTDPQKVTRRYVPAAVQAVLEGRPVEIAETPPVGCAIRFERERRRR